MRTYQQLCVVTRNLWVPGSESRNDGHLPHQG